MSVSPLATKQEIAESVVAKKNEVQKALVKAMRAAGIKFSARKANRNSWSWDPEYTLDFGDPYVPVEIVHEERHNRWNGKLRITVGSYGNKKQFLERKEGFDYPAIAEYIKQAIAGWFSHQDSIARSQRDRELAQAIEAKMRKEYPDVYDYGGIASLDGRCRPDGFSIKIENLNEDQLRALVPWLRDLKTLVQSDDDEEK